MKVKPILFVLMIAAAFAACSEKDLSGGKGQEQKVSDLIVPADFDWKTTRAVDCQIKSDVATRVQIYNDESCDDASLLAVYTVLPTKENPLRLHLPLHLKTVYIKYNGQKIPVDVNEFGLNCILPALDSKDNVEPCNDCNDEDVVYFPCKGEKATIMFEDFFPEKGDYDFNDFVINYNYVIYLKPDGSYEMLSFDLTMELVAMGGLIPYDLAFRLDGVKTDFGGAGAWYGNGARLDDPFSDYDGDICYRIRGMVNKPASCLFLNTDPNETIVPKSELKSVRLDLRFKHRDHDGAIPVLSDLDAFNIFLDKHDLEIHERGFEPARTQYPPGVGPNYYCDERNLVWALTVPKPIRHLKEKVDFLNGYPKFKEWVESGGLKAQNWYAVPDNENFMIIPD